MPQSRELDVDAEPPEGTEEVDEGAACPECGSRRREEDERHGETVCADCGLVLEEGAIDPGPDWRAFDAAQREERSRAGPGRTVMRHDLGLGSKIGYGGGSGERKAQLGRMRRYHRQATYRPGADRNVVRALSEIERIASALGLPESVAETAATTYRRAQGEGFLHGRSIEATAAACVYAAARFQRLPRPLGDVAEHAQADEEDIGRTYRRLSETLNLAVPITYPTDLLPGIVSDLELAPPLQERARALIEATPEEDVVGKNPSSVAAAAVYRAGRQLGRSVTQSEVAEAAGVTEVTLRARLKDLVEEVDGGAPGELATADA
jgi:transcription initiation factor TFIIB